MMLRTIFLGATAALGIATAVSAAVTPASLDKTDSAVTRVADRCGPGNWQDQSGHCDFPGPSRAVRAQCAAGYYLGPSNRCLPRTRR
jgi:hypothetical protein